MRQIRVSEGAYRLLKERAAQERRTISATVDMLMGVSVFLQLRELGGGIPPEEELPITDYGFGDKPPERRVERGK